MDRNDVARWRMRTQVLWDGPATSPAAVVGHLAAAQGQDLLPASWGLAQRTGTTLADVEADCDAGAILRTHALRPTWHFVAPADLRLLLAATAPRVHLRSAPFYRRAGLDHQAFAIVRRTFERELAGGSHRTRTELGVALAAAGLLLVGNFLAYALMWAELEGVVCSGARRGAQQTYALVAERAPAGDAPARDEALVGLAGRFYAARGPATERDLAGWASLTVSEARRATAALHGLVSFELDGARYWHLPGEPPPADDEPRVDLVNGLDELVMSYSESREVLSDEPWRELVPVTFSHCVLVDGRLAGRWAYERDGRGRAARVLVRPRRPWTAPERAGVDAAVRSFGAFVGHPVTWAEG